MSNQGVGLTNFSRASKERRLGNIPGLILLVFIVVLLCQLSFHHNQKEDKSLVYYRALSAPLDADWYKAIFKGSEKTWGELLLLNVQLHDNQAGRHLSYLHLDYKKLMDWLLTAHAVNPDSDYPGFLATRIYAQVSNPQKVRQMIEVVELLFESDPVQHWRRMTEASLIAKHKLGDLQLSLQLAEKVARLPNSIDLPLWARDMRLILLDELNQNESAVILISSMIESGTITDPDELRFLQSRLLKIQQELLESGQTELYE